MGFLVSLLFAATMVLGVGQRTYAEEGMCPGNLEHISSITPYTEVPWGPGWARTNTRLKSHQTGCYAALTTVRRWKYECAYGDQNPVCWEFVGDRLERFWAVQGNELTIGEHHWWGYPQAGSYSLDVRIMSIPADCEATCWNTVDLSNWQELPVCWDRNVQNFRVN